MSQASRIRFSRVPVPRTEHLKDPAPEAAFFDLQRLAFPMELRNWRPGDRFQPLGVAGHQKVQKFFIDRKVPPPQRVRCPLLVSDDRVVWVVGHRIDDSVKITPQTRAVIKGEVLLA